MLTANLHRHRYLVSDRDWTAELKGRAATVKFYTSGNGYGECGVLLALAWQKDFGDGECASLRTQIAQLFGCFLLR